MQITLSYPTAVLSLADVTADPGVDRVTIDIPKDEMKGRRPDGAYSYDGLLALEYGGTQDEPGHSMVKVVRLDSGEDQGSYDTSGKGGTLTCYTKEGFTFFGGDQLLFAQLR